MDQTRVIAISGKARSGKDTTALLLKEALEERGHRVLITHYADLLKFICKEYFNWNGNKDEEGRTLIQYVGTDIVRSRNPDYWVDFIIDILKFFPGKWDYVLLPDCRFPNEIERIREEGFDVIHIRVRREGTDDSMTPAQKSHSSETALDKTLPDMFLYNNEGLEGLRELVNTRLIEAVTRK